ncbi:F-box protein At5g62510-like [Rutidosis leptorrhynchoides]|uniref:F-box protein At5g62510-like n=1 Tax=Rutidosis leptorrhynchoides TaxID=125765 RepID=UPI003A9A3610
MSDYLPFEIQIEIIKKLPIRALLRCRSVSKSWKSLIDSSDFIATFQFSNAPVKHRLLVRYVDSKQKSNVEDDKYVSIVDDDENFPQNKIPMMVPSDVRLRGPDIIGSSQGVLFLWFAPTKFVLWNPTIRKTVPIVVPNLSNNGEFVSVVGFGVCLGSWRSLCMSVPQSEIVDFSVDLNVEDDHVFGAWSSFKLIM